MNADSTAQLLCAKVSNYWLGIEVRNIIEIVKPSAGISSGLKSGQSDARISYAGTDIPVVYLAESIFGRSAEFDDSKRILISEADGKTAALIVDSVEEIIRTDPESIYKTEAATGEVNAEVIAGILETDDKEILVVSVEKIYQLAHVR
jgi:chemotaxis signal transduction protein